MIPVEVFVVIMFVGIGLLSFAFVTGLQAVTNDVSKKFWLTWAAGGICFAVGLFGCMLTT